MLKCKILIKLYVQSCVLICCMYGDSAHLILPIFCILTYILKFYLKLIMSHL